jgi:membrane protein
MMRRPIVDRVLGSWVGRVGGRSVQGVVQVEIFDRAMTLAAQGFTSIFPVIMLAAAIRHGDSESAGASLSQTLGLTPSASEVLDQAVPNSTEVIGGWGLISLVIVLISATSFSRALARMYGKVWVSERVGLRGAWRWLAVIVAVALSVSLIHTLDRLVNGFVFGTAWDFTVTFVIQAFLWTWAPWLLLSGKVSPRLLAPGGVLAGVALVALSVVGHVYVPIAQNAAARQFGSLGVAFTYISWLFVLSFAIVLTTVIGAVVVRDRGWFARLLRGPARIPEGDTVID